MHVYITIYSGLKQLTAFAAIYYEEDMDPGTPQHLRWSPLQQLWMAKCCLLLLRSNPS